MAFTFILPVQPLFLFPKMRIFSRDPSKLINCVRFIYSLASCSVKSFYKRSWGFCIRKAVLRTSQTCSHKDGGGIGQSDPREVQVAQERLRTDHVLAKRQVTAVDGPDGADLTDDVRPLCVSNVVGEEPDDKRAIADNVQRLASSNDCNELWHVCIAVTGEGAVQSDVSLQLHDSAVVVEYSCVKCLLFLFNKSVMRRTMADAPLYTTAIKITQSVELMTKAWKYSSEVRCQSGFAKLQKPRCSWMSGKARSVTLSIH